MISSSDSDGASFLPDRRKPEMSILKGVPELVGNHPPTLAVDTRCKITITDANIHTSAREVYSHRGVDMWGSQRRTFHRCKKCDKLCVILVLNIRLFGLCTGVSAGTGRTRCGVVITKFTER